MASREQDKPSAELLRRSLATAASADDACPEPEILAAYSEHSLATDESARYDLHFSSCPRCREQLAAMARATELAGAAGKDRAPTPGAAWFWDWRWLAPAAAALVIVAVFVARRPSQRQTAEDAAHPLVAMSQPSEPIPAPKYGPMSNMSSANSEPAPPAKSPAIEKKENLKNSGGLDSRAREDAGLQKLVSPPAAPKIAPPVRAEGTAAAQLTRQPAAVPASPPAANAGPVSKERVQNSVSDLPLQSRNYTQQDKSAKPAAAPPPPKPTSSAQSADAVGVRALAETVTVTTAAAPLTTGAADKTSGTNGGAASPTASDADKAPQFIESSKNLSASETVSIEAAVDRDMRTIVRSPDPQVLWRVSSGRVVERSSDAGVTWREQWTNPSAHVVAGSAPSADTCWLVGRGGIVLLTTDGKNWKTIAPPAAADFVSVSADGAVSATVTASDGRQFATSDGGKRWTPAP